MYIDAGHLTDKALDDLEQMLDKIDMEKLSDKPGSTETVSVHHLAPAPVDVKKVGGMIHPSTATQDMRESGSLDGSQKEDKKNKDRSY